MSKMKVYIEVRGGVIQNIECDQKDYIDIVICDYDNYEDEQLSRAKVDAMSSATEKTMNIFLETGEDSRPKGKR